MRSFFFWFSAILGVLFAILAIWLAVSFVQNMVGTGSSQALANDSPSIIAYVTVSGVLVTALGNLFAIVFGWRKDRREAQEFKLRIAELERKLANAAA